MANTVTVYRPRRTFSLPVVLFLIFLTLKLTDFIAWSWWWVTAPLWAPAAAVALFLLLGGLVVLTVALFRTKKTPGRRR